MKHFCLAMLALLVPTGTMAAGRIGYQVNFEWKGSQHAFSNKMTIIASASDLLFSTDFDPGLAGKGGIKVLRVPKQGGARCASFKNIKEDAEWANKYCITLAVGTDGLQTVSYGIENKVLDAAPDQDRNIGKVFRHTYRFTLKLDGRRCDAKLQSASQHLLDGSTNALRSVSHASCTALTG